MPLEDIKEKAINKINSLISYSCRCQCCLDHNRTQIYKLKDTYITMMTAIIEEEGKSLIEKKNHLNILFESMNEHADEMIDILSKLRIECQK